MKRFLIILSMFALLLPFAYANSNEKAFDKEVLCTKITALEEKYKDDFWKEEGHVFCMKCCTKDAMDELAWLVENQQGFNYPDKEIAQTMKKLSHVVYGNGVCYENVSDFRKVTRELAKEAVRLDKDAAKDCLTLALAGVGEEQRGCKGGVCALKTK
ncbi:hypothetical protein HYT26_00740 [Candidatus Pacearchaeota archaeon]|nr:hypothetical protein [Candidatus Pacearchaeota archaeon]